MQKLLSRDLWKAIRAQARQSRRKKAAIAYVTRDLVGFSKGDVLILDASTRAIASGETSAKLLRSLLRKQVSLYHCPDLHAKVLMLDEVAVIGSGNMSDSSTYALVEAGIMTDHAATVSGVASFIEQLVQQSEKLTDDKIKRLCRIKVNKRGGRGKLKGGKHLKTKITQLGNRTWLVGVKELVGDPAPDEQKMIDKAKEALRPKLNDPEEELGWIRWTGKSRFIQESREGDRLIQIWRSHNAKRPSTVYRAVPVLLKQKTKKWTRFYLPPACDTHAEMSWGNFQRLIKLLGYSRRVGPGITHLLESEMAEDIDLKWKSFAIE